MSARASPIDVFVHRVKKYVGAYAALLGGADAIVFTGGIGENSARVRAAVCEGLVYMGVALDPARNATARPRARRASSTSPHARAHAGAGAGHRRGAHDRPRGHPLPPRPHRGHPQRPRAAHPRGRQRAPRAPVARRLRRALRRRLRARAQARRDPARTVRDARDRGPRRTQGRAAQRRDHQPAPQRDPGRGGQDRRVRAGGDRAPLRESGKLDGTPGIRLRGRATEARWRSRTA